MMMLNEAWESDDIGNIFRQEDTGMNVCMRKTDVCMMILR